MTDFLSSVKADLLDRRMLPVFLALGVGLAAALAYAVLGGGSSAATTPPASAPTARVAGLAVSPAPANPKLPVAETANGTSVQRGGASRNPFTPLPSPHPKVSTAPKSKGSSSSSTKESTKSSTSGSSTIPATPSKPAPKPLPVYHVALLFGVLPTGTLPANAQLTPFENVKSFTKLPSTGQPLVEVLGVTVGGKAVVFKIVGEVILHGSATCIPSTSNCLGIELKPGQSEQLEYLPPSGPAVTYELRVASIEAATASTAAVKNALGNRLPAERELLRLKG
jgi:hypothetical protein